MSFRQRDQRHDHEARRWRAWLARWAASLSAVGLPTEVMLSADHWADFLQNGHLDRPAAASTGFGFGQLSPDQMAALLDVLDEMPEAAGQPMAGWLRARLGREEQDGLRPTT